MSVKRYPRLNKDKTIMDKLPYIINKYPRFDPINVLGIETYKANEEDIKEQFPFMCIPPKKREIVYSLKSYKFRCCYCGNEIEEMGHSYDEKVKNKHKKECFCPFFTIVKYPGLIYFKKDIKNFQMIVKSVLSDFDIAFTLKKKYQEDTELLNIIRTDLFSLRRINIITIESLREKHKEFFKFEKINKNGKTVTINAK